MSPLKILVTGSRNWTDRGAVRKALIDVLAKYPTIGTPVLIHGGQRGLDRLAEQEWCALGTDVPGGFQVEVPQVNRRYGSMARYVQIRDMVDATPDLCLVFPAPPRRNDKVGASPWTRHCMHLAEKAGIPVVVHEGQPA